MYNNLTLKRHLLNYIVLIVTDFNFYNSLDINSFIKSNKCQINRFLINVTNIDYYENDIRLNVGKLLLIKKQP